MVTGKGFGANVARAFIDELGKVVRLGRVELIWMESMMRYVTCGLG